jgi:hypothetical protein
VRDLRQAAIESIVRERARAPFASLPDLVARVDLQAKELRNLIQCGALDGLGASADVPFQSRAALLAVAETQPRASKARAAGVMQLAFTFDEPGAPAESAAQRAAWESAVLGLPLTALRDPPSLLPLSEAGGAPVVPEHVSLEVLLGSANPAVASRQPVIGLRLPGWTGGPGFFLWDGHTLVTARQPRVAKAPAPWQLLLVRGHRRGDDWGSFWLEIDELRPLA